MKNISSEKQSQIDLIKSNVVSSLKTAQSILEGIYSIGETVKSRRGKGLAEFIIVEFEPPTSLEGIFIVSAKNKNTGKIQKINLLKTE